MITRRSFVGALAGLPLMGGLLPWCISSEDGGEGGGVIIGEGGGRIIDRTDNRNVKIIPFDRWVLSDLTSEAEFDGRRVEGYPEIKLTTVGQYGKDERSSAGLFGPSDEVEIEFGNRRIPLAMCISFQVVGIVGEPNSFCWEAGWLALDDVERR